MDMTLLRSFIAVADAGTITEAADRIGVTQSALSRRLQQLESHMGAELFARGRHGSELTAVGHLVERQGRELVSRYDQLRRHVSEHMGLERGSVRVGGGATVIGFLLPSMIARFQSKYPGIRFQLKEAGSLEVAADVAAGRLELGLVTVPVPPRELSVRHLLKDRIVLVAVKDHPLAKQRSVASKDLGGYEYVGFEAGSAIRNTIDAALRNVGVEIDVFMELRSIPSIVQMALTTGNLAFVSRTVIAHYPELVEIDVRRLKITRQIALATRQGMPLATAAAAFQQLLLDDKHTDSHAI